VALFPTGRPLVALAAVLTVAGALAVVPGPATAEPAPTLAQVQRQVADLHHEAEQATERYNDARVQMVEVRRQLRGVSNRLTRAEAAVDDLQLVMGRLAAASYKSGGVDLTMQLLLSDEPEAFLQQMSSLDQLSRNQGTALRRVTAARQQLAQDRLAVAQQRQRLSDLQSKLAAEARVVEARIADAESLLAGLRAEERARLEAARRQQTAAARAQRADAPRASRATRAAPGATRATRRTYSGPASGRAAVAVRTAYAQLGDPYRWGGTGPNSFDCSGLTSFAWRAAGVSLPHSSRAQYASGRKVARSDLQPGDLVFFYSPISHVGIYIGGGRMIDAPYPGSSVHITPISQLPYSGAVRP
jgi:peptidoglycan DL-endopeptidase CwlO